ncbi:KEOPS complex component [Haloprofundus marisrubri]|uniref:KEOPS complex component n=1 Tax=Haloprofundus marisrubri TaxID=1514971 RepID=A0A0W1R3T0_9EURY|nr:KEOPS complex subunit Cgi121 [Haloprofundus marisrubri]KTG07987.1 KEOPS complex component [Haloprofundus marisrubri]
MRVVDGVAEIADVDSTVAVLGEVAEEYETTVQAVDARYVVDRAHLERAVELADRAISRGENVAHDRGVEVLLYAAGRRQIDQAFEMGLQEGRVPLVVLVDGGDESAAADAVVEELSLDDTPTLGEYNRARVFEFFEISERELAAMDGTLSDAVRERVALLDVEK